MNLTCLINVLVLSESDRSTKTSKTNGARYIRSGSGSRTGWWGKRDIFSGPSTAVTSAVRSSAGMTGGQHKHCKHSGTTSHTVTLPHTL